MSLLALGRGGCAAALLTLMTAGAQAAPPPKPAAAAARIGVIPMSLAVDDNAVAQAAHVEYVIEGVLRQAKDRGFDFVDPQIKFDPTGIETRKDKLQRGNEALEFGRKAFVALEEGLGLESFDRAISSYEESALWETFHNLTQAMVMRILVKWAEDSNATRKEVARLLAMDPTVEFPKEFTPQDLSVEVARSREAVKFEVLESFDVSSEPVPARIFIDGVFRGITPMSVKRLNKGDHYLSLLAPGYEVVQQIVKVEAGATITVPMKPAPRGQPWITFSAAIDKEFLKEGERDKARAVGTFSGAQQVIVAQLSRGGGRFELVLHRIVAKDRHVIQEVSVKDLLDPDPDFDAKVEKAVTELLATDRPYCENGAKPCGFETKAPPAPIDWHKIKLGVAVGSAAVFTTGVILGIVARSEATSYKRLTQVDANLSSKAAQLRHTAAAADALMALGIVGGAVWGYLAFGLPYVQRTRIPDSPALEKDRSFEKKEPEQKKSTEPDPFAMALPERTAPSVFAAPQLGGWTFGLQGSF
jgi:hypothetical protein